MSLKSSHPPRRRADLGVDVTHDQRQGINPNAVSGGEPPIQKTPLSMGPATFAVRLAVVPHADAWCRVKPLRIQILRTPSRSRGINELDGRRMERKLGAV